MADGPGAGTGRAGVWKAGVWVEDLTAEGAFALSATAALALDGEFNFVGAFALTAEGELEFFSLTTQWSMFHAVAEAGLSMEGLFVQFGAFALTGEADLTIVAIGFGHSNFEMSGEADLVMYGLAEKEGQFGGVQATAEMVFQSYSFQYGFWRTVANASLGFEGAYIPVGAFGPVVANGRLRFAVATNEGFFEPDGTADLSFTGAFNAPGEIAIVGEADGNFFSYFSAIGAMSVDATAQSVWFGGFNGEGAFETEGTADTHVTTGLSFFWGVFSSEGEADSQFSGIDATAPEGFFIMEAEADITTLGFAIQAGNFEGIMGEALYLTQGYFTFIGAFDLLGEAQGQFTSSQFSFFFTEAEALGGFTGQFTSFGEFSMEGEADLRMFWSPFINPGTGEVINEYGPATAGCIEDPSGVSCILDPATGSCIAHPAEALVASGVPGVTIDPTED